jgi:hypothetical protein
MTNDLVSMIIGQIAGIFFLVVMFSIMGVFMFLLLKDILSDT